MFQRKNFQSWSYPIEKQSFKELIKRKRKKIPVSEPPVPLAEGCNHLKTQSQPVDHVS
jgi:hypothetical protein